MGIGFKHGSGGSSPLNFRVVGGTVQPTSPRENDIWVNTDTMITGWIFSATKPENPTEGMVWFATGVTSGAAFNSVRKNGIVLYPMEAQQYVGGAWMKVTAKSYQNGAWKDWWAGELYTPGNEFEEVTGGWVALALKQTSSGNASNPTVTRGEDGLVMSNSDTNYSGGIVYTARKIEISGRSRLVFTGVSNVAQKDRAALTIWSDIGPLQTDNVIASVALPTSEGTVALDISALDGSYYVGFSLYRSTSTTPTVTMRSLRMEDSAGGFVNQVPISTDTDGSIYNGTGYKDNARLSSSGGVSGSAQNGSVVTGFIPYGNLAIVRIKGATWAGLTSSDGHYYINAYDASKTFKIGIAASDTNGSTVASYDATTGVTTFDISKLAESNATRALFKESSFIRLNAKGKGSDLIVTINQEIT